MLLCVLSISLFVGVFTDNSFINVTVMGGSTPVSINSTNTLKLYVPLRIKEIYFGENDSIPILYTDAITDLSDLETLNLIDHGIQEIRQGAFNNLPRLNDLLLDDNELQEITSGIFTYLRNLTRLSLNRNWIKSISSIAFHNLHNLTFLFLASNRLESFDPNWFKHKPTLFLVDLNENLIEEIPDGVFEHYQQAIFLGNNQIKNLSREMFGGGRSLQQLSLHDNEIEGWDDDLFDHIFLGSFDVTNNRIECLDGNFSGIFTAKYTTLGDNPWNCTCLEKIVEFEKKEEENLNIEIDLGSSWEKCNVTDDDDTDDDEI